MKKLDDKTYLDIQRFIELGDDLADRNELEEALIRYQKAYDLLPEPQSQWEPASWILAAIGDTNYFLNNFEASKAAFAEAITCTGGKSNPFINLRLGQSNFELEIIDEAIDGLTRAYAMEGESIFEDEDPKYLAFLKKRNAV